MEKKKIIELLRRIPERENTQVKEVKKKSITVTESNPYTVYKNIADQHKTLEVAIIMNKTKRSFRIKSNSTVLNLICTALYILLEIEDTIENDIDTLDTLRDIRQGTITDKDISAYEPNENTSLDRQCHIKHLGRIFILKRTDTRTIRLYDKDTSTTELVHLLEGMTIGQLRKEKDISMSYNIKEDSHPEIELTDDLLIKKDLFIERTAKKDELILSKDFHREYPITIKYITLLTGEGILAVDTFTIQIIKKSIFTRSSKILSITLNQVVDVITTSMDSKVIYTEGTHQKKIKFKFTNPEDALEFTKYCTLLFLTSQG
ncbi:hypothetical protein NEOKW01_1590 [Nematocida sp. AWRm80]|nr:hypothetical protein NEOKW01_1590 [Nematocida sp. AWRm80]